MVQGNPKPEEVIFKAAVQIHDRRRRQAYVLEACGGHPQLLKGIETLLQYHDAGSFLDAPVFDPEVGWDGPAMTEGPGAIIGRYKLLEKIGEGGMAVVYMAESATGGPIRRRVALKIIKLGMDTRQVIARFEAERQALAMMDHPSIAKVLDAGATETGRPYFVMELVQGVSITEYCDNNRLSTKDRLALFVQVCQAVQHAHQKGIIHRDIKPSNVMVTHHDGKPVPKVIDFGIAKATNQRLTEKTLFTRYAHLIGTPAYMSPEQAELSDLDIDTRSDIYSLGVLLYELLTGTTPFSEEELRKAGYIEMQRVIREQEPVKPSTRIRTAHVARASCPCVPESTGETPMLREVRGDLDWIVMKTLEKDRARRYETASGLAEDIRRHLEHEPVLARGPSPTYRLRKFLRRHRSEVLAALVLAVAAGAAVVGLSQWSQGRRRLAEAEGFRHQAENLRHKETLSQAQEQYARGDRDAALETIKPILDSRHVGPEARLLQAGILVDNRRFDEATTILDRLLRERSEIAGAAHSLLARILWESEPLDAEKLREIDEYRQQAEALLPETAEAYYLRAMTAVTIQEQLASLDRALQLDPSHYESRRLRAFTYYASRKYERMKDDAMVLTVLQPRDPLGCSLHAIAWRELGRYREAIADYDVALALTPKDSPAYTDLSTQWSETLLRMGDYERVIAEAPVETQNLASLQYHVFSALTALGEYDRANALFREIIGSGREARQQFEEWCMKYVFDTLEAGRPWHPADREPFGPAFLPMMEAEDTYRSLRVKGRRVVPDGFSAQWSPDGTRLAFSLGVLGRSGVALYDPATKETDLLIVPGKYPKWSPDGRYIAFVRDRQFLRVPEFVAADPKNQPPAATDEEIWLMKASGSEPRRLARGVWPSWGRESSCVYYRSRSDSTLYSISIMGEAVEPKRIMACPGFNPSVSPDNQYVAYIENTFLKVIDLASQAVVAQWPLPSPSNGWGASAWSPAGNELCLGGSGGLEDTTGLWIYRLDRREPAKTLSGQITIGSWAPAGTKLVFELGAPHYEIWTTDLAPGVSAIESLGPARTAEEHLRELVALQTRRIEADSLDAYAYSNRARCYDCLHDRAKADGDMRRWSAVMGGRSSSDSPFDTPREFRRVIDLPFDCELVFSAERPVNKIPVMSIAFGQKGRCEMKLFEIPMVVTSMLGFCLGSGLNTSPARAGFTFGAPVNLGQAVNSSGGEYGPCLSADGLELYFFRGDSVASMWVARRATLESEWEPAVILGPTVNVHDSSTPFITPDGLMLFLDGNRPGTYGSYDLWVTTRATVNDDWNTPINLGATVNSSSEDWGASLSSDGLELYFTSNRPGGQGHYDLWMTTRATVDGNWRTPINLGPPLNTVAIETFPSISADGLVLFFASGRSGGYGNLDLYMARRATTSDPWGTPVNLGSTVNSTYIDNGVKVSADGSMLSFFSFRPGGFGGGDIWQVPILPTFDFNADSKVDAADLVLLLDNWMWNVPLCDIGPFPWGDGIVDAEDLKILLKHLTASSPITPAMSARDVPCDAILSWMAPVFARSYDVYFGTSFQAVNSASRTSPLDVLVSMGQSEITYAPEKLLEFSETYYWRVDFVGAGPTFTVYRGPVLDFTTEAFAYPMQNITATASSNQRGMGPEKTVDGSGLDANDGHSTEGTDMWFSTDVPPHWIEFEFGKIYTLHELWVWNSNQLIEPILGFGAETVKIEYSTDGTAWTPLDGVPEFARAPGKPGYTANTAVSFGGISAKYVKLTIEKGWGILPSVGLSEVRFFHIPDRSATQP